MMKIIISILIIGALFFIPIIIQNVFLNYIKAAPPSWIVVNGIYISKILGFTGDVIFLILLFKNKFLFKKN